MRQKQDPLEIRGPRVLQTEQERRRVAGVGPAVDARQRVSEKRVVRPGGALLRPLQPVLQNAPPPLDLFRRVAALRARQRRCRPRARQGGAGEQLLQSGPGLQAHG